MSKSRRSRVENKARIRNNLFMKRLTIIISLLAVIFSCAKESETDAILVNNLISNTDGIRVTGIVAQDKTRTEYEPYGSNGLQPRLIAGENGDEIGLYTVYEDRKGNLKANTNLHFKATGTYSMNDSEWALFEAQADYSDKLELGDEVYAYYPYSSSELTVIGETTRADFPTSNGWDGTRTMIIAETQEMVSGSFEKIGKYCPLIAKPTTIQEADGEMKVELKFTNPFAVAKIGIRNKLESKGSMTITGIEWNIPGENLTGKFSVDLTAADPATTVPQAKEANDVVKVTFSDKPTVGYGEAVYAYVVIAPCAQPEVTVTVHTTAGDYVRTVNSPSITEFRRGYLDSQVIGISGENKVISNEKTPLCLEAIENGTITIANPLNLTIEYSKDMTNWIAASETSIMIYVSEGEQVWFRGDNDSYYSDYQYTNIQSDKDCYIYGNIMSLVDSDGFPEKSVINGSYCFKQLFQNNSHIKNHESRPILLPATTLSEECYQNLFAGCSSLTRAPELPALSVPAGAYYNMFMNCASLEECPELPATELALWCYKGMFSGCVRLIQTPELPATELKQGCYSGMFSGCENLRVVSALPALTLDTQCYEFMFSDCVSLESAPILPATTLAKFCYWDMFSGCTALKSFPELPAVNLAEGCYSSMFSGSGLETAPELPATELTQQCYYNMFYNCASLIEAPELPATIMAKECYGSMFARCSSLLEAPSLPALELAEGCYSRMFWQCTSLSSAPELPAENLAVSCYSGMFMGCENLTKIPSILPATELKQECYSDMFNCCRSLTQSPVLPALVLIKRCYEGMFSYCRQLSSIKMLATDVNAKDCLNLWVKEVASTGLFIKHPDATWEISGDNGVPEGWTVVSQSGIISFQDNNFKAFCVDNYDTDGDQEISIAEASGITIMNCSRKSIASLCGIEYFQDLKYLYCSDNLLTSIDLANNSKLIELSCTDNELRSLSLVGLSNLEILSCDNNLLESLSLEETPRLLSLDCGNNLLTSLDLSSTPKIESLYCDSNHLSYLNISGCSKLKILDCGGVHSDNHLSTLDISGCPELIKIDCRGNNLTSLVTSNNPKLEELTCINNQIESLDLSSNPNLKELGVSTNNLSFIDISHNSKLTYFECESNPISSLDVSNNLLLRQLYCGNSSITEIDITNLVDLRVFSCSLTPVSAVDLSKNSQLNTLFCRDTNISLLDVSGNLNLSSVYCQNNKSLNQIWLKTGQTISEFNYSGSPAEIIYVD